MVHDVRSQRRSERAAASGIAYAVAAFASWGVLPLYWKQLEGYPALVLLAYRFAASALFMAAYLSAVHRWDFVRSSFRNPRMAGGLFLASLLIAVNWGVYIWAVEKGHVLDASLGYYINPLVSVALATLFLGETLTRPQVYGIALAAAGVLLMAVEAHVAPWVSLLLAFSFGFYGLLKKVLQADARASIFLETIYLTPIVLAYLFWVGPSAAPETVADVFWLAGAGVVTALPLLWFSEAARRIPLTWIGFIQYLAPTLKFFLGVFVFHEPLGPGRLVGFVLVWAAVAVFALGSRVSEAAEE
ncbi:EamA family transporter RarD [Brockia lithotrophica]|uniref:Chloramphenicol-sensitive protein RarD n=1 Tax=Brockia lithotrophica TaxID=933949 RepID=A0A660KVY6_9BACL|nr:EamA family transporter RarD [Brockia lithotrophica]RKQ84602.1 chloramphenicol-sensitive protein RarD [Brockia lithotrophica]